MNKNFKFQIFNPTGGSGATIFDTNYLDEMKEELVGKIVLEGDTIDWAHVILGVKNRVSLNELTGVGYDEELDSYAVHDATCGWGEISTITLAQRELIVYGKEIKDMICPKTLEQTYLGMYMRSDKEVPFIGVIADQYVKTAKAFTENFIWQGNGSTQDGLLQIIDGEASVVDASSAVDGEATMIGKVNEMLAVTPAAVLRRNDGILCMGYADFMALVQELNTASNFHVTFNEGAPMEFYYPGTRILVKAVAGLDGVTVTTGNAMVLTYKDNVAVGTDMLNDEEVVDIWYSRDQDVVKAHIGWKIGANVYFPEYVVKGYAL